MPYEQLPNSPHHRSPDVFGLTEQEQRNYRLPKTRFEALLNDSTTIIHEVRLDRNNFGEYVFVLMSRIADGQRYGLTFYGLGFHEGREQWMNNIWYWYESHPLDSRYQTALSKAAAHQLLTKYEQQISTETNPIPSKLATWFAYLKDFTDEDFAQSELDDLGD